MNKAQAYETIQLLLNETWDEVSMKVPDVRKITYLLGTIEILRKSFELKESDEISMEVAKIRNNTIKYLNECKKIIEGIYV